SAKCFIEEQCETENESNEQCNTSKFEKSRRTFTKTYTLIEEEIQQQQVVGRGAESSGDVQHHHRTAAGKGQP
ncbi:Hypothetical predicted protein, partial [Mytilus galloprovincialis]